MSPVHPERSRGATSLTELALLFLRLGTTAFGGPAAAGGVLHLTGLAS